MTPCPFCGDRFEGQPETCPRCGIAIQWQGDQPSFEDPGDTVTLVRLFDPATQPVIESVLAAAGIPFMVQADIMQDVVGLGRLAGGYNQIFGPPVVKVPQGMLQAARDAIAPVLADAPPPGSDELPFDEVLTEDGTADPE